MPPSYFQVSERVSPRSSSSVICEPGREERHLADAVGERVVVEPALLEDLEVGQERDHRAAVALLVADAAQLVLGQAAGEPLLEHAAVARDAHQQALGERVHDRDADAVQAAGDLVAVAAELAAGVELRHHDLDRGQAGALDDADRDAGAVVDDRHRSVAVQRHRDGVAASREGFVDAVVEHLPDEVMQAPHAGRADVHAGTAPDRLETFEDRNVLCAVLGISQSPPLPRVRASRATSIA